MARALAKRLRYIYIDTGAMYRAVALQAREKGISAADEEALPLGFIPSDHLFRPRERPASCVTEKT